LKSIVVRLVTNKTNGCICMFMLDITE